MGGEKQEKITMPEGNEDALIKPDPETLNTTDPQEHMSGPVSSLVKSAEESFESNDKDGAAKTGE